MSSLVENIKNRLATLHTQREQLHVRLKEIQAESANIAANISAHNGAIEELDALSKAEPLDRNDCTEERLKEIVGE